MVTKRSSHGNKFLLLNRSQTLQNSRHQYLLRRKNKRPWSKKQKHLESLKLKMTRLWLLISSSRSAKLLPNITLDLWLIKSVKKIKFAVRCAKLKMLHNGQKLSQSMSTGKCSSTPESKTFCMKQSVSRLPFMRRQTKPTWWSPLNACIRGGHLKGKGLCHRTKNPRLRQGNHSKVR